MLSSTVPVANRESLQRHLFRVRSEDAALHAWAYLPENLRSPNYKEGTLANVAFGVKDVIDVEGMPTRYGSAYVSSAPAARDAACVALLRAAGAIPLGKTQTAEFAYRRPPQTRNPAVAGHTPGGSSSGSAAAVAAGMVPFALSTQTGGSIIRPAAYCGVLGFKPSYGLIPRNGLGPGCESLDTIGWHAKDIAVLRRVAHVLLGDSSNQEQVDTPPLSQLNLIAFEKPGEDIPCTEVLENLRAVVSRLSSAGARVYAQTPAQTAALQRFNSAHRVIMVYELARSLRPVVAGHPVVSPPVAQLIEEGKGIALAEYREALAFQAASRGDWQEFAGSADLIISPSAPSAAPVGLENSGSSAYCRAWTFLGWPCLHLPIGTSPDGKPLGFQLVMPWLKDAELLAVAQQIFLEAAVTRTPDSKTTLNGSKQ